ncbi:MAG TPA: hypothetical protein VMW16_07980 [Sedimentisphaerales bacterium]|nr:hypothetical protein [Sedimentisphaerales bacterium]
MSGRHGGVARCDMQAEPLVRRYTWVAVRHARRRACYASGWAFAGTGAPRRILMHRLLLASGLAGLAATGTDGGRGAG